GWYLAFYEVGAQYITSVTTLLGAVGYLYVSLCRFEHDVLRTSVPDKDSFVQPYECVDDEGRLESCGKDECGGAWKPPRAHHCSMCGVCRLNFDHHCPWLGNCVTRQNMARFLLFLILTPAAVALAIAPLFDVLVDQAITAVTISQQDPHARAIWWNWWGSWIFIGGPVGRWVVGGILGIRAQRSQRDSSSDFCHPGCLVALPHIRLMFAAGLGALFALFSLSLALLVARNVLRARTMVEILRPKTIRYIYAPPSYQRLRPGTYAIEPAVSRKLYDLGMSRNWESIMQNHQMALDGR
ncbi:DHHC palmitoyltransferase-domain-containing protein, partial [Schizophyllum fasciatum]